MEMRLEQEKRSCVQLLVFLYAIGSLGCSSIFKTNATNLQDQNVSNIPGKEAGDMGLSSIITNLVLFTCFFFFVLFVLYIWEKRKIKASKD